MKIKKQASQKHENTLSPFLREFITTALEIKDHPELLAHLREFPIIWPFPRGDLYHWINLLNKFDEILEQLVKKYKLKDGPQTIPFEEQDEETILGVLDFSRLLIEQCGNRSLYASSSYLNDLLNTVSLKTLTSTLRLSSRLAQRYYSSRSRTGALSTMANATLLNSHYNINIDKVVKMATPFVGIPGSGNPNAPVIKPTGKTVPVVANNLMKLVEDGTPKADHGKGKAPAGTSSGRWQDFGGVNLSYYVSAATTGQTATAATATPSAPKTPSSANAPKSPTSARRPSGHARDTSGSGRTFDEAISGDGAPSSSSTSGGMNTLEVPVGKVSSTPIIELLKQHLPNIPSDYHYEFLQRLRVAKALTESAETRREILGIRILSLTNLAYVLSESNFHAKILTPDMDEPRRLQMVYQLAGMVNPSEGHNVPRWLQTLAFGGLEALARHKLKVNDVNTALSINVNHGALLTLTRQAVAELKDEGKGNSIVIDRDEEEWREALLSLVGYLPSNQTSGSVLVSAGLIPTLVDLMNVRSIKGIRIVVRALQYLDALVYGIPPAFQAFANAKGLDSIVDLVAHHVTSAMVELKSPGGGYPASYRSNVLDFQISYYRANILKTVFKFTHHMMGQTGGNSDRLLRNLIDSPKLLEALRTVISNGRIFGNYVWSAAVNILTTFIHNEPTSYAVIHEAKLSHCFLESITGTKVVDSTEASATATATTGPEVAEAETENRDTEAMTVDNPDEAATAAASSSSSAAQPSQDAATQQQQSGADPTEHPASEIIPALEVINTIPLAFGAICLNSAGLELFKTSGALPKFFEVFESQEHVKCMAESDLATTLGSQFDELVRHHPPLKEDIMKVTVDMVRRVVEFGRLAAKKRGVGAKIWMEDEQGRTVVSGGRQALSGEGRRAVKLDDETSEEPKPTAASGDVEMQDADAPGDDPPGAATVSEEASSESQQQPSQPPATAQPQQEQDQQQEQQQQQQASSTEETQPNEPVELAEIGDDDENSSSQTTSISTYIDVMSRFLEGFLTHTSHSRDFVKHGGLDCLLEIYFLPSLPYDFASRAVSLALSRVMHLCGEASPTATLPALLKNTQKAVDELKPLLEHDSEEAFFKPLTDKTATSKDTEASPSSKVNVRDNGTKIVKDLVTVHALSTLLSELYSQALFNVRTTTQLFQPNTQRGFYETLVPSLGALHRACVWEEILLQKSIPDTWNEATKVKDSSLVVNPDEEILGPDGQELPQKTQEEKVKEKEAAEKIVVEKEGKSPWFKNVKTLRFLISQIPNSITPFFQGLARVLITRRSSDQVHKKYAFKIGDAISEVLCQHLTWKRLETSTSVTDRYSYWIVMLSSISALLLEGGDRSSTPQIITTVLITFKQNDGIKAVTNILRTFWEDLQSLSIASGEQSQHTRMGYCFGGIKVILSLFAHIVDSKSVLESTQTSALQSRDRDRDRPDYFNPHQLLVEIRMAVLEIVQDMWNSQSIEKAFTSIVKSIIDILGIILKSDGESGAFTRTDKSGHPTMISWKSFEPDEDRVRQLTDMGFSREVALEGLVQNNNSIQSAAEWLLSHPDYGHRQTTRSLPADDSESESDSQTDNEAMAGVEEDAPPARLVREVLAAVSRDVDQELGLAGSGPVEGEGSVSAPGGESAAAPSISEQPVAEPAAEPAAAVPAAENDDNSVPAPVPPPVQPAQDTEATMSTEEVVAQPGSIDVVTVPPTAEAVDGDNDLAMNMSIDDISGIGLTVPVMAPQPQEEEGAAASASGETRAEATEDKGKGKDQTVQGGASDVVTVEDLEDVRAGIRKDLINRALDVLQVQHDVTFELSSLIMNAFSKPTDNVESRKEIASTIVQSLMSLQMEEDIRPRGATVAATAHFLGLIIQKDDFFTASLEDLKEQIPVLVGYIKVYPDEPAPWLAKILLIVEKMLTESAQPKTVKFTPPTLDARVPTPAVETGDYTIPVEEQQTIFDAIVECIPLVGKEEATALAIIRVLVLLTRKREIAVRMAEPKHLSLIFQLFKSLAGSDTAKVQSCIMMILRHIIEDDATLKAIMCSEIRQFYQNRGARGARQIDTNTYIRQLSHMVLRNPEVFVEATNELCKLTRYESNTRYQQIVMKETEEPKEDEEESKEESEEAKDSTDTGESSSSAAAAGAAATAATATPSKEPAKEDTETKKEPQEKPKPVPDVRPPGLDNPDGVVHFLLCELLSIRDAGQSEGAAKPTEKDVEAKPSTSSTAPAEASKESEGTDAASPATETSSKSDKPEKVEFKAAEHPTYLYRCFLLQALTEILACYNKSKVEFINFSRKTQPRDPITPSKPRSYILNYLLNDLIPVGSLSHADDIPFKKRCLTSNWAISVIVSLCSQTGEAQNLEDEPDLVFVRKFVLESSLKAFKDAGASSEHLDAKYARLLNLSDLFYRMLSSRPNAGQGSQILETSQKQLARIMFEKNFVAALTNSLADIDLNFPAARRVIKYILRPLKLLSKTAIDLGDSSDLATPGGEEDEISTASTMSELEDEREETPDLYRNSALSMFEGGEMADDDEASDFGEEDEEMYEEMDFEEEEERTNSEESDEDEILGDQGEQMDVEIVMDNGDIGSGDDDEDEFSDEDDIDDDNEGDDLPPEVQEHIAFNEEEEWEASEGSNADEEDIHREAAEEVLDHVNRVIEGDDDPMDDLGEDRDDGFIDDGDEEEEEEDDEDDDDELDVVHEEEIEEDDAAMSNVPWGWSDDIGDAPLMTRGTGRGGGWYTLGGPRDMLRTTARVNEENLQNPLLQPSALEQVHHRPHTLRHGPGEGGMADFFHAFDSITAPGIGNTQGGGPVSWLSTIMNLVSRSGALPLASNGTLQFQIQGGPGSFGLPAEFEAMIGVRRSHHDQRHRDHRSDPISAVHFTPVPTVQRWSDESRLAYGSSGHEKAAKVVNAILAKLVPPAIEEERVRKEKEEARKRKEEEDRLKREEEERLAREKAEAEERERREAEEARLAAERAAQEAAEAEARAAAEAAAAQEAAATAAASSGEDQSGERAEDAMEGVVSTEGGAGGEENAAEAGPSAPPPARAVVMIRGREMDITGMDIDPEFLEALPEDMREEVFTQHIRERQQAAVANDETNEISSEFLAALPEEIRTELLQQQEAEQRRRERERQRAASGQTRGPADIDLASFLATLDPGLRQTVLLEQNDEALAHFPDAIAAEANALRGDRRLQQFSDITRVVRARPEEPKPAEKKIVRKSAIQMLDKAGVATLLRLMFIPQQGSTRMSLHEILLNVCENRQNRGEVINLLLSILQDGSADMTAVERSFAQLSLRAKQSSVLKTPQLKRMNTNQFAQSNSEMSPLMVAQQCLGALAFLVNYNEHIPSYFLNEHESAIGLKRSGSKKGKGKETQQSKASRFALNTLLGLLDRQLITESSSVMDQLSVLLSEITRPLTILLRKDKKKEEEKKAEPTATDETPATTTEQGATAETAEAAGEQAAAAAGQTGEAQPEPPSDQAEAGATAAAEDAAAKNEEAAKVEEKPKEEEKPKKQRTLIPPVVPEYNLRLVVNIITARECTGKTFRETVTTMLNLSAIPGAKDVFGAELIHQAQGLGGLILESLSELVSQIKRADSGTDLQGLSKFSAGSSDQAKLLRTLTALDYLFDNNQRKKRDDADSSKDDDSKDDSADAEALSRLYESLTFTPLWSQLSNCLTAIEGREDMLHVATILLPLIEALMVVCKNSGLNDKTGRYREQTPSVTSPRATTDMERLFFAFTEDHRKILNQMVRSNPKLMSGSFSLLVHNPKVLDFDNKRNYFNRRLHSRSSARESHHNTLQLNVRRDQVFLDSYRAMYFKGGDEIKYSKLSIRFQGEEGVDAGGVTREWFQVLARQMFNPDYALFLPVASDRTTFHPNRMSAVNPEHLSFFKFIGRIIGKALYEGRVLDCHFSRAVYKRLLGQNVSLKDMETLDLEYYKSLVWMLENDITDVITENFCIESEEFGAETIVDLIPNGRNIAVTQDNKHEYVRLVIEYKLLNSVKEQMENFLKGFHDIVPAELVAIFNEQELELLISGLPDIDVDDWRNNTEYHNYSASSPQIQWFWRAVRSFDKEERAKLLQFATGTSKVPLNGFKELEGMNGFSKFNIHRDYGSKDRLPSSHTCFNQIDLPEYEDYESLRQNLHTAVTQGAEYFGFA